MESGACRVGPNRGECVVSTRPAHKNSSQSENSLTSPAVPVTGHLACTQSWQLSVRQLPAAGSLSVTHPHKPYHFLIYLFIYIFHRFVCSLLSLSDLLSLSHYLGKVAFNKYGMGQTKKTNNTPPADAAIWHVGCSLKSFSSSSSSSNFWKGFYHSFLFEVIMFLPNIDF